MPFVTSQTFCIRLFNLSIISKNIYYMNRSAFSKKEKKTSTSELWSSVSRSISFNIQERRQIYCELKIRILTSMNLNLMYSKKHLLQKVQDRKKSIGF